MTDHKDPHPSAEGSVSIKPCPFCGEGETQVIPKTMWTGMRSQPISTTVRHWCVRPEGQPQSHVDITGRDTPDAIAAWNRRAAPPQPAGLAVEASERERFTVDAKRRGWTPGDFMLGAYAGWLAAKADAAHQQAPQAVVSASEWVAVDDQRPEFIGEDDTPVWTWDGTQVREDEYGLEWDQPAGPVIGGWVVTGEGFQGDTLGTVTHWMYRTPPSAPEHDAARRSTRSDGDAASAGQGEVA